MDFVGRRKHRRARRGCRYQPTCSSVIRLLRQQSEFYHPRAALNDRSCDTFENIMDRRNFVQSAGVAGVTLSGMALPAQTGRAGAARSLVEVRKILFRNNRENRRAAYVKFLEASFAPALKRAGVETLGFFNNDVGPDKPHVLCLFGYRSGDALVHVEDAPRADKDFQTALRQLHGKGPIFERIESSLFRAFSATPKIEIPKGSGPLYFELRTYESDDPVSLSKKIEMFESGEISIFRQYGLMPVFFGEALVGRRMPNLTYMVAFENAAARLEAWRKFASSPEWDKMKQTPGWSDAEVVSNITNATYTALPFSEIR